QFTGLLPNLRAVDNVALAALLNGTDCKTAYDRAQDLLGQVGLQERWDAYPGQLSGGQQRRVALARALVNQPALLLADEPTNDLDEQAEQEVLALLLKLPRRHNATLIVVTHDRHLAEQADRIVSLRGSKLVSVVAPEPSALAEDHPVARLPAVPSMPLAEVPVAEGLVPGELTPLGSGLGRFLVGFAGWVLLVAALLWGGNYVAARWQQKTIVQKQEVRKRSQELALQKLRADIEDVAYQGDGSYAATI